MVVHKKVKGEVDYNDGEFAEVFRDQGQDSRGDRKVLVKSKVLSGGSPT
jgi:hypothetical protein